MSARELVLHASTLRVVLRFDGAERTARAIERVWQLASLRRFVEPRREVRYAVIARGGGYVLEHPSGELRFANEGMLAPQLEGLMYQEIFAQHRSDALCVLHASAVVAGTRVILFAGQSGAGKSALARASVDAGLQYLADEHVVTDGSSVWGLPRAIHLDHHALDEPSPPWHCGADLTSYRICDSGGRWHCTPLVPVSPQQVPSAAVPIEGGVLVSLRHGERDEVSPLSAVTRLTAIQESALVATDALGAVATLRSALSLGWRDPNTALQLLRGALGLPRSSRTDATLDAVDLT